MLDAKHLCKLIAESRQPIMFEVYKYFGNYKYFEGESSINQTFCLLYGGFYMSEKTYTISEIQPFKVAPIRGGYDK